MGPIDQIDPIDPQRWLRHLDRTADRGVLWALIAAGLVAGGRGPRRRAGVRGVLAAAASAGVVHAVARPLLPRSRPWARRFPSSHAAVATAFVTGVAMEIPVLGAALAPLALVVAGARVALEERSATDVVAGVALGGGVALLTRRWWPALTPGVARARPARDAPALGQGAGLVLVANASAGTPGPLEALGQLVVPPDEDEPTDGVDAVLPRAQVLHPAPGVDFVAEVQDALARPMPEGAAPRAVGVAGGDGSVAALAGVAQRHGVPLVVLPEGTLNHFARDVGIVDTPSALAAARDGHAVAVDVGLVDITRDEAGSTTESVAFVNTASLGGYPDMVRLRERWEGRWGKWPAAALALMRVLAGASPLAVEIDGRRLTVWLMFVGNGAYLPIGMAPVYRPRLDARVLDVRYLRADLPFSRTRFVLAVLAGTLIRSRVYVATTRTRLSVRVLGPPIGLATDGEVQPDADRFVFRIAPDPVPVYRPAD